jgi:hypothetical protein
MQIDLAFRKSGITPTCRGVPVSRSGGTDSDAAARLGTAWTRRSIARSAHPHWLPIRKPRLILLRAECSEGAGAPGFRICAMSICPLPPGSNIAVVPEGPTFSRCALAVSSGEVTCAKARRFRVEANPKI